MAAAAILDFSEVKFDVTGIVREYVFYVFLKIQKNATFYVFLKRLSKKRKNVIQKFEVSDFADFSPHGISTTALNQCIFIIYMALVIEYRTTNLIKCGI